MNNLIGQSLGRYHILEQLGEGGMATVYKAYDTRLESEVAVKVIRTEQLAPSILERALKRFEREAKALARLTHSNIVKVQDYGEYEGKPYLVMPYLAGGTLKQLLNGKPMGYQEAAKILSPIARALGYAHQQGMVHRDVKPSNILITQSGDPMLTDFGIAKIIDEEVTMDLTGTSAAVGTPEYMAPEQVTSKSVDYRADIYGLGIVFYEMVTGRRPFQADTPMAVLFKHASEPLPRPKSFVANLPDSVEQILMKALAKHPEDRYQDMGEFASALDRVVVQAAGVNHGRKSEKTSRNIDIKPANTPVTISLRKIGWAALIVVPILVALVVWATLWITGQSGKNQSVDSGKLSGVPSATSIINSPLGPSPSVNPLNTLSPIQAGSPIATLKIISDLPMTGSSLNQSQPIVNAEQLRLAQANYQACGGKYTLSFEVWDDALAATGYWDPAIETANANKAAAEKSVVVYLGTFNSGAAKLSIPILNQAGPLLMVSPANTYGGLTTKVGADVAGGEPDKYYPTGTRNYARVVTNDNVQGQVDANFMFTKLGVKSIYILDDNELYGQGVANMFESTAKSLGMTIAGHDSIDPKAADYKALMTKISTSNNGAAPDGIFVGMVVDNNAAQLLKDKVAIMGDNTKVKYMGPDGIQTQAFIDGSGASTAEGAYASVAGLAFPDALSDAGKKFVTDYEAKYGKLTEPYSIYGYEDMSVVLAAIERICSAGGDPSDRATLTKAVMATKDFKGVLGTWSFDANGDTTLTDMTVYQVKNGTYVGVGSFK